MLTPPDAGAPAALPPDAERRPNHKNDHVVFPTWDRASLSARRPPTDGARLYAKSRHAWIYPERDASRQWIGFLWTGGSVRLRSATPQVGNGCTGFYAILPSGYVCTDGGRVTTDPNDPELVAVYPYAPRTDSPFLHRYGESRGAPLYRSLPSLKEQYAREGDLRAQLERIERVRRGEPIPPSLLQVDLTDSPSDALVFPKLRANIHEAHTRLLNRSTVAYSAEVRHEGRNFLLTSDYAFVPKDRVAVYPMSRFHGIKLAESGQWPLGFFRDDDRPRMRRNTAGAFEPTGTKFERLAAVELTGRRERADGVEYVELRSGEYAVRADIVLPELAQSTPWGTPVDGAKEPLRPPDSPPPNTAPSTPPSAVPKGRQTWLEVSILGGWLMAYEGTRPVFATLISPGRGGLPQRGRDPLETGATPLGRFVITGKFSSATMVAPGEFIHSEVPYAQNFSGPYALHTAYWHDRFGHPMSGGCINLSPIDGHYLYEWTEPPVKPGWYGQRWLPNSEPTTTLIIRP